MSVRYFCDQCGAEMNDDDHNRIHRKLGRVTVEIIHTLDACANSGHVCHACIIKTVNDGTDEKS